MRRRLVSISTAKWLARLTLLAMACASPGAKDEAHDPVAAPAPAPAKADTAAEKPAPSPEPAAPEAAAKPEPAAPAWEPRPEDRVTPHLALDRPEALATFYDRLARIDDGNEELVRVVHLGASMIGADDLPAVLRRKFQTRFGDGGAGLVLLQRYMPNYLNRWVEMQAEGWEHCYIAYLCKRDGHYGLGGTTFWSDGGAWTKLSTRQDALGDEVSRFELWYVAHSKGGRVELRVDREEPVVIRTRADELEDRYHAIDVPRGPHSIRVKALGGGRVRGYGVVLETNGPGMTWEQFSMLGAFTRRMLGWDPDHIAGQIRHRDPDLIVFTYGGNDTRRVATGKLTSEQYIGEYVESIGRVRAGKPEAACLVTAMVDRAKSLEYKITAEHTKLIVDAQRVAAEKAGCAFFDSYTAMGGAGSMRAWRDKDPPLASGDLKHLNHRGREILGGWIYDAVITGYVAHRTAG